MSYPVYGRVQAPEPLSNLLFLHTHDAAAPLKVVLHEPKVGVLDQSDLTAQGIFTDQLVPGARRVDALGSCTANTLTEAASNVLDQPQFTGFVYGNVSYSKVTGVYDDVKACEEAAIVFYHQESMQTGSPATEWPPTDCGSSGPFIVREAIARRVCKSQRIAHSPQDVCSLLQSDGVMCGSPFFYSWEEPDAQGFIDGNGTASDLQTAIRSGVAGGHEYYLFGIEKIAFDAHGNVDPYKTVIAWRNHWSKSWGDSGNARVHLSTLAMLGGHVDYRQIAR